VKIIEREYKSVSVRQGPQVGVITLIIHGLGRDSNASLSPKEARVLAYTLLCEAEKTELGSRGKS